MIEDASTGKEKALVDILCLGTKEKKIHWRSFDGGYATDISTVFHGFVKVAIQQINTAYCLQIRSNSTIVIDKAYHSFDPIYISCVELYEMLDKKVDKADAVISDLLAYFNHIRTESKEPLPCPQQNP